jgi:hypothetical protein
MAEPIFRFRDSAEPELPSLPKEKCRQHANWNANCIQEHFDRQRTMFERKSDNQTPPLQQVTTGDDKNGKQKRSSQCVSWTKETYGCTSNGKNEPLGQAKPSRNNDGR